MCKKEGAYKNMEKLEENSTMKEALLLPELIFPQRINNLHRKNWCSCRKILTRVVTVVRIMYSLLSIS
jgi:hypothetical protein